MLRIAAAWFVACLLFLSSCGGGGSTTSTSSSSGNLALAGPAPAPGPAPASSPGTIALGAGQSVSGVDITVSTPADSPTPNVQMLGVAPIGQGGSASNVGDVIHRGSTMKILLFGPGLTGAMTVTISGPKDIAVSNVRGITAIDSTPGVAFDATVSANAALGARTVSLRSPTNDITALTGGLEVLP